MKKILVIICFFALYANAQVEQVFKTTDRALVDNFIDDVLASTVNKYSFVTDSADKCRNCISLYYSDSIHTLNIFFYKKKEGGNKDLETPDTVIYRFGSIRGIYKDLFPFWKKHFQPGADFKKIATDEHGEVIQFKTGGYVASFNGNAGRWSIELKSY